MRPWTLFSVTVEQIFSNYFDYEINPLYNIRYIFTLFCVVLIEKEGDFSDKKRAIPINRSFGTFQKEFKMTDACDFLRSGTEVNFKNYTRVSARHMFILIISSIL